MPVRHRSHRARRGAVALVVAALAGAAPAAAPPDPPVVARHSAGDGTSFLLTAGSALQSGRASFALDANPPADAQDSPYASGTPIVTRNLSLAGHRALVVAAGTA